MRAHRLEHFHHGVVVDGLTVQRPADHGAQVVVADGERIGIAEGALKLALRYAQEREAFGKPILDFQNTRFTLADIKAKLQVGWAHLDWALARHLKRELTAEEGAAAKLWHTELQWEVMDKCLQLHGGAGYMNEYPIAKQFRGARVTRIFGGTSEIMKELIGRKL